MMLFTAALQCSARQSIGYWGMRLPVANSDRHLLVQGMLASLPCPCACSENLVKRSKGTLRERHGCEQMMQ